MLNNLQVMSKYLKEGLSEITNNRIQTNIAKNEKLITKSYAELKSYYRTMKNKELSKQKLILDNLLIEEKEKNTSISITSAASIAMISSIISYIAAHIFHLSNLTNTLTLLYFNYKIPEENITPEIFKQFTNMQFENTTNMVIESFLIILPMFLIIFIIIVAYLTSINKRRVCRLKNINLRLSIINEIIASTKSR